MSHTEATDTRSFCKIQLSLLYVFYLTHDSVQWRENDQSKVPHVGPEVVINTEGRHVFLRLEHATDFCQCRRSDVYSTRDRRRKVYDLFLIYTELE